MLSCVEMASFPAMPGGLVPSTFGKGGIAYIYARIKYFTTYAAV